VDAASEEIHPPIEAIGQQASDDPIQISDEFSSATSPIGRPSIVPHDERLQALSRIISSRTLEGWNIVARNDHEVNAVLSLPGKRVNHVLHAILTIVTCLIWGIVWIILVANQQKEQRVRVTIDAQGNLLQESITVQ
jgi:hypothetical protein